MTESEVDALLDEVRVIRDTTDDPRARQAAELILQDAALSAAERAALFGPDCGACPRAARRLSPDVTEPDGREAWTGAIVKSASF